MKIISTKLHGLLDYIVAAFLAASPWIFGFAENGAETWVPVCAGAATIIYSLITDYELGWMPLLSMKTHLVLDALSGVLLILSPYIFGFTDKPYQTHIAIGIAELLVTGLTRSQTKRSSSKH